MLNRPFNIICIAYILIKLSIKLSNCLYKFLIPIFPKMFIEQQFQMSRLNTAVAKMLFSPVIGQIDIFLSFDWPDYNVICRMIGQIIMLSVLWLARL